MSALDEQKRRWRLVLGEETDGTLGKPAGGDVGVDQALAALYDPEGLNGLRGVRGASSPRVSRWLGDIRTYFPSSVVRVMQRDALTRLNMEAMLLEKEILETVEADVHLVANLLSLKEIIPEKTKETARTVVAGVVKELMARLAEPMRASVSGALNRAARTHRPRHGDINWNATIRANLKHYQRDFQTIIPERLIGFGRKSQQQQRHIILCVDQSGSMASSVVYSGIFGAVIASLPSVGAHMVVFDTSVVDLTDQLDDPVDVLFGVQLGGGTDINRAVGYCQRLIREPGNTIFVLISDLYEGGVAKGLLQRMGDLVSSGVQCVTLLALSDEGAPSYDAELAAQLTALGAPAFACTPDLFPDLMAAAIKREDLNQWAARREITVQRAAPDGVPR